MRMFVADPVTGSRAGDRPANFGQERPVNEDTFGLTHQRRVRDYLDFQIFGFSDLSRRDRGREAAGNSCNFSINGNI